MAKLREPLEDEYICLPVEWVDSVRQRAVETVSGTEIETCPRDNKARSVFNPSRKYIINTWFIETVYNPLNQTMTVPWNFTSHLTMDLCCDHY